MSAIFGMTQVQAHRGPDGEGFLIANADGVRVGRARADLEHATDGYLALAHRRLAIIDTTEAGLQPMAFDNSQYWITYNGEVYNYLELRDELERMGATFRTRTDTEVILAAYREWGVQCFERFNGMWALAIWDVAQRKVVIARDRLGVKPLHYLCCDGRLYVASEIKALLNGSGLRARLVPAVAADYLRWGVVNHEDTTFFTDIMSFPSGHYAEIDLDQPEVVRPRRYWRLDAQRSLDALSMDEAAHEFRTLFLSSVELRLRSDVAVGSCLSGGLDSSSIVCVAAATARARGVNTPLNSFTSCFDDERFDERRWCALVEVNAELTPHHVFPAPSGLVDQWDALLWHQEEPFTSSSIYAQWEVMRAARRAGVPVLLDGQGADEILCGYRKFLIFYLRELIAMRRPLAVLSALATIAARGDRGLLRWREGSRYLPATLQRRLPSFELALADRFKPAWEASAVPLSSGTTVRDRQVADVLKFSLPSLLRYEDRNSMAWSIESRVPFLDYRLVEFAIALPTRLKLAGGRTKAVMRAALRGLVPDAILDRRDKMGFVTPQESWLKGELRDFIRGSIHEPELRVAPLFERTGLDRLLTNPGANSAALPVADAFRFAVLESWMRRFDVEVKL